MSQHDTTAAPLQDDPNTCRRCGAALRMDLNGVTHCRDCRKHARTPLERKTASARMLAGVAFAHLPNTDEE